MEIRNPYVLIPLSALFLSGLAGCDTRESTMHPTNVFLNAGALSQQCESIDLQAQSVCAGYLVAVADSIEHYRAALPKAEAENYPLHTRACLPDNIAVSELIQTFSNWSTTNSDALGSTAYSMVLQAYSEHWSCQPNE